MNITIAATAALAGPQRRLDVRLAASADDAEERATGIVNLTSGDLELVHDADDQTVGLRFAGVNVPPGATIVHAPVQFVADGVQWTHIDIAAPAYNTGGPWGYTGKGGTGVPTRTMFTVAR